MAKVPYSYTPQVAPVQHPTPFQDIKGITADAFGYGIGTAIKELGGALQKASDVMQKRQDELDNFNAAKTINDFNTSEQERFMRAQREGNPDGSNFRDNFMAEHDKRRAAIAGSVSPRLQAEYSERFNNLRNRFSLGALEHEFKQRDVYYKSETERQVGDFSSAALRDPSTTDAQIAAANDLLRKSGLPLDKKAEMEVGSRDVIISAGINGLIQQGRRDEARAMRDRYYGVVGGSEMDRAKRAVASIESSGGNYGLVGKETKGDRPYGKYQVMGKNIGAWTKKWFGTELTPEQFLANPDAQERVFEGQFGEYMRAYGPAGAAAAWFAGPEGREKLGATDKFGTSVDAYVRMFSDKFVVAVPSVEGAKPLYPNAEKAMYWEHQFDKLEGRASPQAAQALQDYSNYIRQGNARNPATEQKFVQEFGAGIAQDLEKRFAKDYQLGQAVNTIKDGSPEQVRAVEEGYRKALESSEDFTQNAENYKQIAAAIERRRVDLAADPALYSQRSKEVADAVEEMRSARTNEAVQAAASKYARLSLAEQQRLGVPLESQNIITKAQGDNIRQQWDSLGGQASANLMVSLRQQWGDDWKHVFEDLVRMKVLPSVAMVVGTMDMPDQRYAASELAIASKLEDKELKKSVTDPELKIEGNEGVRTKVGKEMATFWSTLTYNPIGVSTFAAFREAAETLAIWRLGHGTPDVDKAAKSAVEDILDKKYVFNGTYRVPKTVDADAISRGIEPILLTVLPTANLDVPTVGRAPGMRDTDARNSYIRSLQTNGIFVTSPKEDGLDLHVAGGGLVTTDGGKPFTLTWEQISQIARDVVQPSVAPAGVP